MNAVNRFRPLPIVVALQAVFAMPMAQAADFTVNSATPVTTGQALNTAGNTGTVTSGSTLSTNGSTQAVTLTGSGTITLNNSGTIEQTGTARAIRNNAGPITFRLNNSGTISSLADDVLKMGVAASVFEFSNQGTIWQKGTGTASGQALDLRDLTSTGNVITNGSATNSSAMIRADGDDALRPGRNITITNYGTIISNGVVNTKCADYLGTLCTGAASAHDAIDIGGNTGVVVNNYGTISGPRHAITADTSVTVTNYAGGQIIGRNGSGVGSDGTGTVVNYGLISGRYAGAGMAYDFLNNRNTYTDPTQTTVNNGDGDGVDIDGVGTITNYGRIEGLGGGGYDSGGRPNGGDGLALGGGTVNNMAGAVIWGKSNGILVDDGANGTDTTNTVGNKNRGTATAAASAVSITNSGEITGDRKVAIGLVGTWDDTVVNNAAPA
jgi:subtilase-type serine protease